MNLSEKQNVCSLIFEEMPTEVTDTIKIVSEYAADTSIQEVIKVIENNSQGIGNNYTYSF